MKHFFQRGIRKKKINFFVCRQMGQTFKLVLEMITATTFILLDRLFYETLDIVAKHALVEYTQIGTLIDAFVFMTS